MKYLILKDSLDEKIVGKDFPQVYKFTKDYKVDSLKARYSLDKYYDHFRRYISKLDGIMPSGLL